MKTLVLCLLTGCFVLPKTSTTTRDLGTEVGPMKHAEPIEQLSVRAELAGSTVEVHATAQRTCSRPIYRVTEVRKEKHARYKHPDARAALPAAIFAIVTLPVSAAVTGLVVLADGDGDVSKHRAVQRTESFACTTPAERQPIALHMPSGTMFTELTDDDGVLRVRIPDTEPYRGVVAVTSGAAHTELAYAREVPAITNVRDTVLACGARHDVRGAVKVELSIDEEGHASFVGLDTGGEAFLGCVHDGLQQTRFSHRSAKLVLPLVLPG